MGDNGNSHAFVLATARCRCLVAAAAPTQRCFPWSVDSALDNLAPLSRCLLHCPRTHFSAFGGPLLPSTRLSCTRTRIARAAVALCSPRAGFRWWCALRAVLCCADPYGTEIASRADTHARFIAIAGKRQKQKKHRGNPR